MMLVVINRLLYTKEPTDSSCEKCNCIALDLAEIKPAALGFRCSALPTRNHAVVVYRRLAMHGFCSSVGTVSVEAANNIDSEGGH